MRKRNVVLTGLPRSGTSLTCSLPDKAPNTVALNAPITPGRFAELLPDLDAVADGIEQYTAMLPQLASRLPCYALVRNPLAVLASRFSLGRSVDSSKWVPKPAALRYDAALRRRMAEVDRGSVE